MEITFCIDKQIKGKAYPNMATHKATPFTQKWKEFSVNRPFSEPLMLLEHLDEHDIEYNTVTLSNADKDTFYPIALSYFDFDIKWFDIMSEKLLNKIKDKDIKILFYYSEGDNPYIIDEHLTQQCTDNDIPREQIKFISANSEATKIDNFFHVVDDELLFRFRNAKWCLIPAMGHAHHLKRSHNFLKFNGNLIKSRDSIREKN